MAIRLSCRLLNKHEHLGVEQTLKQPESLRQELEDNRAFKDASLERQSALPPDGAQYEFAGYSHPDEPRDARMQETQLHMEGPHAIHRRRTGSSRYGDNEDNDDDTALENLMRRLPSRQLESAANNAAKTLHHRHSRKKSMYVRGMEDSEDFIEDMLDNASLSDADDEERVEEAIRSIPTTMAARRSMIRKLSSRKKRAPGFVKRTKYSFGMGWKHFKDNVAELKYMLQLWYSHLKKIEGNFGTDVLSYFLFLKWLLLLNIPTLLLTLGFLLVPQVLFRWLQQDHPGYVSNQEFSGIELLTGAGWFSPTELYYGYYTNQTIEISSGKKYEMQIAYLFTCGGYYLLTLIILGHSILRSYRKYYIEAGGIQNMHIVFKVLGSWDFGLTSAEAVKLKHKSTCNEMKEYLAGASKSRKLKSLADGCKLFWLRVFTNLVFLGLTGGAGYLVYFLSNTQQTYTTAAAASNTSQTVKGVSQDVAEKAWLLLLLPLVIGSIFLILPLIFTFIESYEQYEDPKTELYMHLGRSMLLRVAVLTVLVYYWYGQVAPSPDILCWETFMGQELYRLVIVDFLFTLISTFVWEFLRRLLAARVKSLQHPTFAIGRNTLELIYSQALCWLGVFYAPLLSLIVMIKLIFIFYVKMISVLQNCKPSERPWRARRSHTVFLGFLFVFYLCCLGAVGVGIIFVKPSTGCGPYQGKDVMYSVVPELVDDWSEDYPFLTSIIDFVASPGFIATVLVALGMGVYLIRTIMIGRKETVQRLKQQLLMEGRDKTFLLNLLNQVSQRQNTTVMPASGDRPFTQQMASKDNFTSPGGRVFVRKIAESTVAAR